MVTVKNNKFKGIEKNPSVLGFGCMRFPTKEDGSIDYEKSMEMIDYAYNNGVTYFDTAYPYHNGESEIFIGHALKKYPRESFYLADKMPTWHVKSLEDVKRIFNEQLKKTQVEYFDYYLLHALNKDTYVNYRIPGVMDYLYDLKKKGIIRHLGFSFHDSPEVLKDILEEFEFDFVQIQLNYLDWDYQKASEQYQIIKDYNLPIVIMEPVRGGTLADLGSDCNNILKGFNNDASIASWAIRYAMDKEQVMTVLSGMSTFEQVMDNINTASPFIPFNNEEKLVLDKTLKQFLDSRIIPCTGCRYCMDCPMGVDIPLNFKQYNNYRISKREKGFIKWFIESDKNASLCVGCNKCVSKCPQHIDIPNRFKDILEFINANKEKYSENL